MGKTVVASAAQSLTASHTNTGDLGSSFSGNPQLVVNTALPSTMVSKLYFKDLNVTSTSIDLTTGSATPDIYGAAQVFTQVSALQISNYSSTVGLVIGSGTNSVFSTTQTLPAGGSIQFTGTIPVDGTHKLLWLASTGTACPTSLMLVGN
jgi:hypothetical protein